MIKNNFIFWELQIRSLVLKIFFFSHYRQNNHSILSKAAPVIYRFSERTPPSWNWCVLDLLISLQLIHSFFRICKTIIFALCFCLNIYLIHHLWDKWINSPVLVMFAQTAVPVWNVPFPAVTICSEVKSKSFDFSYHMSNMFWYTQEKATWVELTLL